MANEENVSRGDQWNPFGPDAGNASDNSDSGDGLKVSTVDKDPIPEELSGKGNSARRGNPAKDSSRGEGGKGQKEDEDLFSELREGRSSFRRSSK